MAVSGWRRRGTDERSGGMSLAARCAVAEVERRDGERAGEPVRVAALERGGDVPPARPQRAGLPNELLGERPPCPATPLAPTPAAPVPC